MCNFIKASSDFVSGTMTGNTCVLSENGPPGEASGAPPGRRKRQAPTVNLETFAIDNTPFFAVQDKVVGYIFILSKLLCIG